MKKCAHNQCLDVRIFWCCVNILHKLPKYWEYRCLERVFCCDFLRILKKLHTWPRLLQCRAAAAIWQSRSDYMAEPRIREYCCDYECRHRAQMGKCACEPISVHKKLRLNRKQFKWAILKFKQWPEAVNVLTILRGKMGWRYSLIWGKPLGNKGSKQQNEKHRIAFA